MEGGTREVTANGAPLARRDEQFTAPYGMGDIPTMFGAPYMRYLKQYGARKFWLDDIWHFDWEACRLHAKSRGIPDVPAVPVHAPPRALVAAMDALSTLHRVQRRLRHRLTGRSAPRFA